MNKIWDVRKNNVKLVESLAEALKVSKIIANLLVLRGIKTFNDAKLFFRPDISKLHDPFLMKNMQKAVIRLDNAIKKNQKILIYGDYDVDGTTSVAMVYSFLKRYNQNIEYYIPCRYNEGYGISFEGIDYAYTNNFSLVIALDCGIRAIDQIDYANRKSIDVIICDHHNPSEIIPNAIAILNPKQIDCPYPYKELSGCGVGFKLIHAYSIKNNISINQVTKYLDLVAVSIAADIVPVNGENRVLAYYGLKKINSNPCTGLKALISEFQQSDLYTMSDLVFKISPRINAAGRIAHAKKAVEILVEEEYTNAKLFAAEIELNNNSRKDLDQKITKEALKMIDENKKSTVVFSKNWHKGVVGIVASRLIEFSYKPTIVLAESDGLLTGSARSVHDFNLYEAISKCSHLCEKFGGHKYAAGLSIKKENLNKFIDAFEAEVQNTIKKEQLMPRIKVDMEIDVNDIDEKLLRIIKQFAPFGPLNMSPVFISRGVIDNGYGRQIGKDKSHLKVSLKTSKGLISGIGFGMGDFFQKINNSKPFDLCYSIKENEWNGRKSLQLMIVDIN